MKLVNGTQYVQFLIFFTRLLSYNINYDGIRQFPKNLLSRGISCVASIHLQSLFSPKQLFEINEFRESSNFAAHIKQNQKRNLERNLDFQPMLCLYNIQTRRMLCVYNDTKRKVYRQCLRFYSYNEIMNFSQANKLITGALITFMNGFRSQQ